MLVRARAGQPARAPASRCCASSAPGSPPGRPASPGPSGSGKSTLLRLLDRLADPEAGTVRYRGADVRERDPLELRREVGLVPQLPALLEGTVADNVRFAAELAGREPDVDRLLDLAGLDASFAERDAREALGRRAAAGDARPGAGARAAGAAARRADLGARPSRDRARSRRRCRAARAARISTSSRHPRPRPGAADVGLAGADRGRARGRRRARASACSTGAG